MKRIRLTSGLPPQTSASPLCLGLGGETCEGCGLAAGERAELLLGAVAARGEKEIDRPRGVRFDLRAQGG